MRMLILLAAALFTVNVAADEPQKIYRHVEPDGTVTFSDEPMDDDATEVDLPPLSVVETDPPPLRPSTGDGSGPGEPQDRSNRAAETPAYTQFEFTAPLPDESLWGTGGQVMAAVALQPGLAEAHRIRYSLDGAAVVETRSAQIALTDVYRGQHVLAAEIIDANGRVLASANPVVFHMKQPSLLNPAHPANRQQPGG